MPRLPVKMKKVHPSKLWRLFGGGTQEGVVRGEVALQRRWLSGLFAIGAVALSVELLLRAIPIMVAQASVFPYDGFIDWGGGREMWEGRDPYSPAGLKAIGLTPENGLGHPPTALVWFFPFARFDVMMMKHVFTVFTLLMLLYHVGIVTRALRFSLWPFVTLLAFSAVYQTDWFLLHLSQVDLSELIAFLYVLSWLSLRGGRDILGGVMVGLACTLKLYPGLMVIFLMAARRWRAAMAAAITYLIFVVEVTRRLGPGCFKNFFDQTRSYADQYIASIRNASVDGVVHRWFYPPWHQFPLGRPVLLKAGLIAAGISVVIFALAWVVSARRVRESRREPRLIDLPFALFTILSMAPGPYQWEHYGVTLILPFFVILADALSGERNRRWWGRVVVTSAILGAVVLMLDVNLSVRRSWEYGRDDPGHVATALFYDVTTWLPWFVLATVLGIRLFQLDGRDFGRRFAGPGVGGSRLGQ